MFLAGCIAGAAQLSLAVPVDLIKVRLQSLHGRVRGPFHCLETIYKEGGLRGCYKGFTAQAMRDIKASGIYFVIYHWCLDKMRKDKTSNSATDIFIAGGLAGELLLSLIRHSP